MRTRIIHAIAGSFIIISLLMAIYINIHWLWFTAFVGTNLFQSSLTNWCLMDTLLKRIGVNNDPKKDF